MTRNMIGYMAGLLLAGAPAWAAQITLTVDNATPAVGATVSVTIHASVSAGEAFVSANQFLTFDRTRLELVEQSAGTAGGFVGDSQGLAAINAWGEVRAGVYSLTPISGSVTLGVFRFRTLAGGTTLVTARGYDAQSAPFGALLVAMDYTQIVPGTPGALTLTIGGSDPYTTWRQAHFTAEQLADPLISGDNADPDHDGLTNQQEYWAGTDPLSASSCLVLYAPTSNPAADGKFVVRWQSVTGRVYTVQATTNLLAGFSNLRTNILATPVVNVHTDNVAGVGCRFYRVKVE